MVDLIFNELELLVSIVFVNNNNLVNKMKIKN